MNTKSKKYLFRFLTFLFSITLISSYFHFSALLTDKSSITHAKDLKQNLSVQVNTPLLKPKHVLFLGDSITYQFPVNTFFPDLLLPAVNLGISGQTSEQLFEHLNENIYDLQPKKLFLLIGTNDLVIPTRTLPEISETIKKTILAFKKNMPHTQVYLQSVYPVNQTDFVKPSQKKMVGRRTNKEIQIVNSLIKQVAISTQTTYLDVYPELLDEQEQLNKKYSYDGLHLTDAGYQIVADFLLPYLK